MISLNTTSQPSIDFVAGLPTAPSAQRYPMQEAQLEIWLSSQQSAEASCAYNEIFTLKITGPLDRAALETALQEVYQRHGSLRSTFDSVKLEVIEHSNRTLEIEWIDWSNMDPEEIGSRRREWIDQLSKQAFDLEQGPLFRAIVQQVHSQQYFLTIAAHHLVMDGWSVGVIVRELGQFYDQVQSGNIEPIHRYQDYAATMQRLAHSPQGQADLQYWIDQFSEGVPTLELPLSGSRQKLRTYRAARFDLTLSSDLVQQLRKLGAKQSCSLYNTMLAAFQAFLAQLCQCRDIVLAIPTSGQATLEFPNLVGQCVHTLPLRVGVESNDSFIEFLKKSRNQLLTAIDHQSCSFGTLIKHLPGQRDPSRPPLCNVSFNLDPVINREEIGFKELHIDLTIEPRAFENFEWFVNGVIRQDHSIELQVQYNTDLFDADHIEAYLEGFVGFLKYLVAHPQAKLAEIPLMNLAQRQQLVVDWNQTNMDYPRDGSLISEFRRQAEVTAEKMAVCCNGQSMTYRQLDQQSDWFAQYLIDRGIQAGDLVGICSSRSIRLPVQLLGVLKTGAGYVPLDPQYPLERLQYMCEDSGLKLVVTEDEYLERANSFNKPTITFEQFQAVVDSIQVKSLPTVKPQQICYVIYTSGSTGKPKGVMVPHGSVINFLYSMRQQPGYQSDETMLAITTLSFDIAVLELYLPLLFGGKVVIADHVTSTDGKKLIDVLDQQQIGLMQATPATYRMMIAAGWPGKSDLKVLCGGEPMPVDLVQPLLERCQQLWNMYGPTETTVWSSCYQIESAADPILIGKPIGNTQIFLLDPYGREVPIGVEGELMIGGAGVTLGYLNRPELTNDRFIENPYFNPFEDYLNHRLYRTGDIACYRADGNIEYRRRNDKQVKLRGYRIELGEIESAIQSFPGVRQTAVMVRTDQSDDHRLVAYVVGLNNNDAATESLRQHLRQLLPHYMIPQYFVQLESFPLTDNGKVDLKSLPAPHQQPAVTSIVPCQTPAEKYLANVWQEILGVAEVSLHDNFFNVGGHSLLVMQVINRVEADHGLRLNPQEFLLGTLEQLATELDELPLAEVKTQVTAKTRANTSKLETYSETLMPVENQEPSGESDSTPNDSKSVFDCLKKFWG